MRTETAARLKVLEEQYWGMRDGTISEKKIKTDDVNTPGAKSAKGGSILKNKNEGESLAKPKFDYNNLKKGKGGGSKSRSRSKSVKRKQKSISPP